MELYLSDFTAFLEIWVGSILLLIYKSDKLSIKEYIRRIINNQVSLSNQTKNLIEQYIILNDDGIREFLGIHNNYLELYKTLDSITFSLKQTIKRLNYIALVALVYGLIIIFYLGIEKKFPSIYPVLTVTNILVFLYILLLYFVNDKYIKTITYLFILLFGSFFLILCITHTCFPAAMNRFILSRSIITILTLITCCFSLFIVIYIRFITFKFQLQATINKFNRLQQEEIQKFESEFRELFQNQPNGLEEKKEK